MSVTNNGTRSVQVGSHFHFAEANGALSFNRDKAIGMRLDIPSGTSVRFEPGEEKTVTLVEIGGRKRSEASTAWPIRIWMSGEKEKTLSNLKKPDGWRRRSDENVT